MNKADKFKLLYVLGISLIFFFTGCVDTSVQNIPTSFDFHSQLKVVNLSTNGGAATIKGVDVNNAQFMSVSGANPGDEYPGSGTAFMDVQSGTKTFYINYANAPADTFKQTLDTEYKMRLYIVDVDSVTRTMVKSVERYTWQEKGTANGAKLFPSDTASFTVFNGSPDVSIAKIIVKGSSVDTTISLSTALSLGSGTPYMKFKASGSYTISLWSSSDSLTTVTLNPQAQSRYSTVIYGKSGAVNGKVFTDD